MRPGITSLLSVLMSSSCPPSLTMPSTLIVVRVSRSRSKCTPCHLMSSLLPWSQNIVITSWLRLTATSNCFPHPHCTYPKCLSTLIDCSLAYSSSLTQFYHPTSLIFLGSGSLVESKECHCVMVEADSHLKLLPFPY